MFMCAYENIFVEIDLLGLLLLLLSCFVFQVLKAASEP